MIVSALADTHFTYQNIIKYGVEFEGHPVVRSMMETFGTEEGLLMPKAAMMPLVLLLSYTDKGKYLPTIAAAVWGFGALANVVMANYASMFGG